MIEIKPGERVAVLGQSGSGKTVLMGHLARSVLKRPVFIIDSKYDDTFLKIRPGASFVTEDGRKALSAIKDVPVVIWRPTEDALIRPEAGEMAEVLGSLLARGHVSVLVDEGYQLGKSKELVGLLTRGRSRKITTVVGSQRPRWLTRFVFSEASQVFVFYLQDREDRKRIREIGPYPIDLELEKTVFWHWRVGDKAGVLKKVEAPWLNNIPSERYWL